MTTLLKYITGLFWFILLFTLIAVTLIEKTEGADYAHDEIYDSYPFVGLWTIFTLVSVCYMLRRKLFNRPFTFLLHLALLVIAAGACCTWATAERGIMRLTPHDAQNTFVHTNGTKYSLPFSVMLNSFDIAYYKGTSMPMDFVSHIVIQESDSTTARNATLSMNHIVSHRGYRFYQSGFDNESTVLTVAHDPWGIGITYTGYALLLLTFVLFFLSRKTRYHSLLHQLKVGRNTLVLLLLFLGVNSSSQAHNEGHKLPQVLPAEVAAHFGNLYVYYNDRICPLQTFARDFTLKLYGKETYRGLSAEQVFTGWMFYYDSWKKEPIFRIKSKKARDLMHVEGEYATLQNFFNDYNQLCLDEPIAHISRGEPVTDARGIQEANEKFVIVSQVATGSAIRIFPYRSAHEQVLNWYAQVDQLPQELSHGEWVFIRKVLDYIQEKVLLQQWDEVKGLLDKIKIYQEKKGGELLPSLTKFRAEKIYNQLEYTTPFIITLLVLGLLYYFYHVVLLLQQQNPQRIIAQMVDVFYLSLWLYLTIVMSLRAYVSNHLPLSNGYETMQLMAWLTLLFTLLFRNKYFFVRPFGLLITSFALLVSILSFSNPQITSLMPVLASPLLSIHVMIIMLAYALLMFIMLNGLTALIIYTREKTQTETLKTIHIMSEVLLTPAVFLLGTGIFIGAVWANISWGRYWGWDPKETWALITFLVYAWAIHVESYNWFRRPLFFHTFCVFAFFTVLITYFGVNYLLGGMHSYA